MVFRTASCACGQLRVQVEGEPRGVGIYHCLACQQRTGSVFTTLASFAAPFKVFGIGTEYVRVGDQRARFTFRFCPVCGATVFHTEEGNNESVSVAVGAFADRPSRRLEFPSTTAVGTHGFSCRQARQRSREGPHVITRSVRPAQMAKVTPVVMRHRPRDRLDSDASVGELI
jgi:hypothetical protein